ncbi:LAMI_0C10176g1_1 [Lachancea mirantina]|uniref:LAMI_0C10176g1_1 n=1 Tax=Lachancea mirantina TaxID=1230905 RepID=A0A1G4J5K2_9SACH|nr:LAMI_0C10176g1_1 [Lachancea mirantina]
MVTKLAVSKNEYRSKDGFKDGYQVANRKDLKRRNEKREVTLITDINQLKRKILHLKSGIKILNSYEKETEVENLAFKWRRICQAGMAYMLNSTLIKIDKMGGYEELVRREIEAEKRKIEYQFSDNLEQDIENLLESEEFKMLSTDEQQEYRDKMDAKRQEVEDLQQKELQKLEEKLGKTRETQMTMQELARRLNVDYKMVFEE